MHGTSGKGVLAFIVAAAAMAGLMLATPLQAQDIDRDLFVQHGGAAAGFDADVAIAVAVEVPKNEIAGGDTPAEEVMEPAAEPPLEVGLRRRPVHGYLFSTVSTELFSCATLSLFCRFC